MLTEAEARQLVCPINNVAVAARVPSGMGGLGGFTYPNNCIASRCMMWRWRRRYADDAPDSKTTGYCGMAGKP